MRHVVSDPQPLPSQALTFTTHWVEPTHAVVSVSGDIDAANADTFLDGALTKLVLCRTLTMDLRKVEFFSSAAYSSLCILARRCATADVDMTVAPSACVRRVLEICGGAAGFAVSDAVPADPSPV